MATVGAVIAALVAAVAGAFVVGGGLGVPGGRLAGTAVAAERIIVDAAAAPAVPIQRARTDPPAETPATRGDLAVAAVLADLERFWLASPATRNGLRFTPPAGGYVSFDAAASSGAALCITAPRQILGNAYYCPEGDGIVFDSTALVPLLLDRYGSAGLVAALAHEFGHAVQAKVGVSAAEQSADPARYPSVLIEAQADCASGAFLAWVVSGAAAAVELGEPSMLRAVTPLLELRDPITLDPLGPSAHGLAVDRLAFVLDGYRRGGAACLALTREDIAAALTLGRSGTLVDSASAAPRYPDETAALAAATASVRAFLAGASGAGPEPDLPASAAEDLAAAGPFGQFAAGTAVAIAAGQARYGSAAGGACIAGAWTASVFGTAGNGELGSWAGDPDEALDLVRTRPGATFADLAAFSDGFRLGLPACG